MDDFDAEALARKIRVAAERGRLVASLRPSWTQLGQGLWDFHDHAQSVLFPGETRQSLVAEAKSFVHYSNSSPCAGDVTALKGSRTNFENELVLRLLRMYLGGLVNHLGGLSALLSAEVSARPAVALGRVILDASTHCAFLLESVPPADRALRAVNLQLAMLRAEVTDVAEGSGTDFGQALEPLQLEIDRIIQDGLEDGFTRAVSKKNQPQNSFVPGTPAIEKLFTAFGDSDLFRDSWRHASSVVHVQERRIMEFYFGSAETSQETHGRSYVALQMMPSVLVAKQALSRACWYLGLDSDRINHSADRLLELWAAAAGLRDKDLLSAHTGPLSGN